MRRYIAHPWSLAFAAAAITSGVLVSMAPLLVGVVALGCIGILACLRVAVSTLPAIAVYAFVFNPLPYSVITTQYASRFITPSLMVLVVWLIRRTSPDADQQQRSLTLAALLGAVLSVWLIGGILVSDARMRSIMWTVTFLLVLLVISAATYATADEARSATNAVLLSATILGTVAILEGVIQSSILGNFFDRQDGTSLQHWSVYRVTTTLGHPLVNALFFACAGVLALAVLASFRSFAAVAALLASCAGLYFTVSRGGVIAFIVGVATVVMLLIFRAGVPTRWKVVAIGGCIAATTIFLSSPLAATRDGSADGRGSTIVRQELPAQVLDVVAKDFYLGSGPGTSISRFLQAGYPYPVESSAFQLLISLGALGLLTTALLTGILLIVLFRSSWPYSAAICIAYIVMISTFSVMDDYVGVLTLLPLLVASSRLSILGAAVGVESETCQRSWVSGGKSAASHRSRKEFHGKADPLC